MLVVCACLFVNVQQSLPMIKVVCALRTSRKYVMVSLKAINRVKSANNSNSVQSLLLRLRHLKVRSARGKRPCAVPQVLEVCHARQAHPDVRLRIILVPVLLVADERLPLIVDLGMYAEHLVGREHEDLVVGRGCLVQCVVAKFHLFPMISFRASRQKASILTSQTPGVVSRGFSA